MSSAMMIRKFGRSDAETWKALRRQRARAKSKRWDSFGSEVNVALRGFIEFKVCSTGLQDQLVCVSEKLEGD